jgi:hypothetical protein
MAWGVFRQPPRRIFRTVAQRTPPAVAPAGVEYTDSATVGFALTPSSTDVAEFVDAATVPLALTPSATDIAEFVDSDTASLLFTASGTDLAVFADSVTVPLALTPGGVEGIGDKYPAKLGESTGTQYYVDNVNGNDSWDGLAPAFVSGTNGPKKTIASAWSALPAGASSSIVNLRNTGVHEGAGGALLDITFPVSKYGTSKDQPLTIRTYPADLKGQFGLPGTRGEAIIRGRLKFQPGDGNSEDYNGGAGCNFKIQNLEIKDALHNGENGREGIWLGNAINAEVSGCYIHDNGTQGILVRGWGRTTTLSSSLTASATTANVVATSQWTNATPFYVVIGGGNGIEIVKVTAMTSTTITIERGQLGTSGAAHSSGVVCEGYFRSKNVQVFNNRISGNGDGGTWAKDQGHAHGIYWASDNGAIDGVVYNNLLYDNDAYGINCYENADGTLFAHNTIVNHGRGGVTISGESVHASDNTIWKNNVIVDCFVPSLNTGGYAFDSYMTGAFGPGSGNIVDHNLWYNATNGYHRTGADANGITFSESSPGVINSDPLFVNKTGKNFELQSSSPAIGVADTAYAPEFDMLGRGRYGQADYGALEYTPVVLVTFTPSGIEGGYLDADTAYQTLTPSGIDEQVFVDTDTARLVYTPSGADAVTFVDLSTVGVVFTLSGTDVEVHVDTATEYLKFTPDAIFAGTDFGTEELKLTPITVVEIWFLFDTLLEATLSRRWNATMDRKWSGAHFSKWSGGVNGRTWAAVLTGRKWSSALQRKWIPTFGGRGEG